MSSFKSGCLCVNGHIYDEHKVFWFSLYLEANSTCVGSCWASESQDVDENL